MATNPSMLAPGDFDVEQAAITRKRAVYEAMAKKAMETTDGGKMVSGAYIPEHWLEGVSKLYGAYKSGQGNKELDTQSADLTNRYQAGLGEAVKGYLDTRNGAENSVDNQGPMPDGSAMEGQHTETIKADPRKAIVEAMTSQYKPLQELGKAELGGLGKQTMTPKDMLALAGYSPQSKVAAAMAGDPNLLKAERKDTVVNNQLIRSDGEGAPNVAFDGRDHYDPVGSIGTTPDGKPIIGQTETTTKKATFAPSGTTVNVDTGAKGATAFSVKANEAAVGQLTESHTAAKKAQGSFQVFSNAKSLIDKVGGGSGADWILQGKKIAQALGAPIDDTVTAQEQVSAAVAQAVLDNSKSLGSGSGFTDKDREFLQNVVMGKVSLDPATLKRAVDAGLAGSLNTMRDHHTLMEGAGNIEGATPAVLNQFKVPSPHYVLDGNSFEFDPATNHYIVKTSAGTGVTPGGPNASVRPANTGLSPAEKAELAALKAKHGVP